ncbi:MAG: hypothetical protein KBA66_12010 [Leptospiraceae bacterium]|nr:hypothetical protein [Leptospiraceae bacterium]
MKFLKSIIYSIFVMNLLFVNCGDKENKSKTQTAALIAALPMIRSDIPFLGTETATGTNGQTPLTASSGIYSSRYIPQNFSLRIPVNPQNSPSTQVDLSKCYIDQNVDSGDLASSNSRLCGIAFDQVKLELHALFLDLALPHIRALCHNKLPKCDLSGQVIDITLSEPVMNTIQKLYDFYAYVGLQPYFLYNGYELKNGAKLPYELSVYEEVEHPVYEYRAVIKQRVISTQGTQVQERPGAADITIYWNKTRKNILFQFQTNVEVFNYKVNARRVYDYSVPDSRIFLTTELDYWTESEYAFRFGQSAVVKECASGDKCVQYKGIAGFFIGNDADKNGLTGSEVYYHSLRSSSGVADNNGGVLKNSYPESGRLDEMLVHRAKNEILFQLEPGAILNGWNISSFSPNQSPELLTSNYYWQTFVSPNGEVNTNQISSTITTSTGIPEFPKIIFWQATSEPFSSLPLNGFRVTGNSSSVKLRFADSVDDSYRSQFLPDGTRNYWKSN